MNKTTMKMIGVAAGTWLALELLDKAVGVRSRLPNFGSSSTAPAA